MTQSNQICVIPETHVIRSVCGAPPGGLSFRVDGKGREFVSFADDDSKLEWKISKSHDSSSGAINHIRSWNRDFTVNVTVSVPMLESGETVFGKAQVEILEHLCLEYLTEKDASLMCASGWQVSNDHIDDILSSGGPNDGQCTFGGGSEEIVPETTSVKIDSVVQFQKFIRRLQNCADSDSTLFVRFVVFKRGIILHVVFSTLETSVASMSVVPAARSAKKSGNPVYGNFSVTQRCLLPLFAGNSKAFLLLMPSKEQLEKSSVLCQSLLDLCERTCLTALTCFPEGSMRVEDFEVLGSMDLAPIRSVVKRIVSIPSVEVSVEVTPLEEEVLRENVAQLDAELEEVRRSSIMANDSSYDASEHEVQELRAKNLILRAEIDRIKINSSAASGANAYTNHLLSEVKQLRQELASVESERRKYLTSKRLVESLIEKSNKSKAEVVAKQSKVEELRKSEELLRKEMTEMKRNCEHLIDLNRTLERDLNAARQIPSPPPVPPVESTYHQFLFPFQRKREMEKNFHCIHDSLGKIERAVAVNCPSSILDVRRSSDSLSKLKDCVNELLSASEKLEISAVTLLKNSAKSTHRNAKTN